MKNDYSKRSGFTLVEMLVVISIIALLAGLLFPAVGSAIRTAKRTRARNEVQGLVAAFQAYYTEFGYWPTNTTESLQVTTNTFQNARGVIFYDFALKDVDMLSGFYQDPWKHSYWFRVDHDYNRSIPNPFTGDGNIGAGVVVWSMGPDETAALNRKKGDPCNRNVVTTW